MNELMPIPQLKTEIQFYERQTATGMLEIGKRLIQIKGQLPHGEFTGWIQRELNYSYQTANRFMKCYEEYGNISTSGSLSQSQMVEMLGLPEEVKTEIIENNNMDEITIRELRKEVNQYKERSQILTEQNDQLMSERVKQPEPEIIEKVVEKVVAVYPPDYEEVKQKNRDLTRYNANLNGDYGKALEENKALRQQAKEKTYYKGLDIGVFIAYLREFISNMKKYEAFKDDFRNLTDEDERTISTWIDRTRDQLTIMEMLKNNMEVTIIE